jgi:thioredoxin reductase
MNVNDGRNEYDVVVVGGGAAGLSAALVLTRARRRVAIVDAGQPRNAPAPHMHGFLGSDGLPPAALLSAGRDEVARYGGQHIAGVVTEISPTASSSLRFGVTLHDGRELHARRVLITTGMRDELPDIPGLPERWARDLLHCPYCHGYEVRDQPIGVIGGSPEAVQHAQLIRQWSDDVIFFPHTSTVTAVEREQLTARGISIVGGSITRLVIHGDHLAGVELASGQVVPRTAVFVRPRPVPNIDLLSRLAVASHDNGWVIVDSTGRTSVAGVWAAGNAANPKAQVITAAGEGSAAAIALNADLVQEDIHLAVANLPQRSPN